MDHPAPTRARSRPGPPGASGRGVRYAADRYRPGPRGRWHHALDGPARQPPRQRAPSGRHASHAPAGRWMEGVLSGAALGPTAGRPPPPHPSHLAPNPSPIAPRPSRSRASPTVPTPPATRHTGGPVRIHRGLPRPEALATGPRPQITSRLGASGGMTQFTRRGVRSDNARQQSILQRYGRSPGEDHETRKRPCLRPARRLNRHRSVSRLVRPLQQCSPTSFARVQITMRGHRRSNPTLILSGHSGATTFAIRNGLHLLQLIVADIER